jgi:hypothetical protein
MQDLEEEGWCLVLIVGSLESSMPIDGPAEHNSPLGRLAEHPLCPPLLGDLVGEGGSHSFDSSKCTVGSDHIQVQRSDQPQTMRHATLVDQKTPEATLA